MPLSAGVWISGSAVGSGSVDWGDGISPDDVFSSSGQLVAVTKSAPYAAPGDFTITATDAASHAETVVTHHTGSRPLITGLDPYVIAEGTPQVTLVATGTFDGSQKILINGVAVPTTYGVDPTTECSVVLDTSALQAGDGVVFAIENADGTRSSGTSLLIEPAAEKAVPQRKKKSK